MKQCVVSTATMYSFRFDSGPCAWALFLLHPSTGLFTLSCDHGYFAHRWNLQGFDHDMALDSFLCHADASYIVDKFKQSNAELDDDYDEDTGMHKKSHTYVVLCDTLLPFFQNWLAAYLEHKESPDEQ